MRNSFLAAILLLISFSSSVNSQKSDFQWVFGNDRVNGSNTEINNIQFDFNNRPVKIEGIDSIDMQFYAQRTAISDSSGNLVFYSNGCRIFNKRGELMINGDSLNHGTVFNDYCDEITGWNTYPGAYQSMVALPQPLSDSIWYLFHISNLVNPEVITEYIFYTKINISSENGFGKVIQKNIILDSLPEFGKLNAVYSHNLEKWYILQSKWLSDEYNIYQLDSSGIELYQHQTIGETTPEGNGGGYHTRFSPDGQLFATYNPLVGLELFDFDRSSGTLSNARFLPAWVNPDSTFWGGIEFSPNGRFLYAGSGFYLDQFDLDNPDLADSRSRIAILDSPSDEIFKPQFTQLQLGPDCRLYIFCTSCSFVHIIHRPDEAGTACMLEQRAIETPSPYFRGAPLYPKYRMRALGDTTSICDHVTESIFTSVSDPGQGITEIPAFLYPNPARAEIRVIFATSLANTHYALYDLQGKIVRSGNEEYLPAGVALKMNIEGLNAGSYVLRILNDAGQVWTEKVVVAR